MKTAAEVNAAPEAASPIELMCATVDNMAIAIRGAIEKDNRAVLLEALECMESAAATLRRWIEEGTQ